VVALEFIVNRHDLAANVGHLRVTFQLIACELPHLVGIVMRHTGTLSRPRKAVRRRGTLPTLEQHVQSTSQLNEPKPQIGRDTHATDRTAAAKRRIPSISRSKDRP
jgi:hypothetical protein